VLARDRSRRTGPWAVVALALALAGTVALAGCGTSNTDRGRQLFITKCGQCHTLSQAGTSAEVGPDLDAAFAEARATGMDSDTVEGVVKAQVESPRPSESSNPAVSMPPNLVEGQDLDDVAAYVGSVAGVPGAKPPPLGTPMDIFAQKCSSCHTLKAAQANGTTGPDLDKVLPGMSASEILDSIISPDAKIASGYSAGIMPSTFGDQIPKKKLDALVKYLMESAGK
jgi:mono/diheme cytochrome c family protein